MLYRTILFDIDGVMLSEERYFDASALTVYELLTSPQYLGFEVAQLPPFAPSLPEDSIRLIRTQVFANDEVLYGMKGVGVNANWDMVYLQTAHQLYRVIRQWVEHIGVEQAKAQLQSMTQAGWTRTALRNLGEAVRESGVTPSVKFIDYLDVYRACTNKQGLFDALDDALCSLFGRDIPVFSQDRTLWTVGQEAFQEWYLGDAYVTDTHQPGKRGFLADEVPIVTSEEFSDLLSRCKQLSIEIGIATGRPSIETRVPLTNMGWMQYFSLNRVSTASDVLEAEGRFPGAAPLSKPHPFSYLRSYLGESDASLVLDHVLPLAPEVGRDILIIGDSVADCLAARALGCDFAAVLTGLDGVAAKPKFEQLGVQRIWSSVLELGKILAESGTN